jgi:hypothetical protein
LESISDEDAQRLPAEMNGVMDSDGLNPQKLTKHNDGFNHERASKLRQ